CKQCVDAGYTSVMIDGSSLSKEENIKLTKRVSLYAHKFGVSVEGEIGKIEGIEDNTKSLESILTSPKDAEYFIEKTGVDSLAISIGTSHGAYKFVGESKLEIDRLKLINKQVNNFPLVLHGASSVSENLVQNFCLAGGNLLSAKGVDDNSIRQAIDGGICKINVDTDLRIAFTTGVRKTLLDKKIYSLRDYLKPAIEIMKNEVVNKINLFNNKK
ncbi:MAG: class II fructose-bisphosphate aldolase, partial [Christensenellales bacterium]